MDTVEHLTPIMKTITFRIRSDFEETLSFEDLGLDPDETSEEVIQAAAAIQLSNLYECDCITYDEEIIINGFS